VARFRKSAGLQILFSGVCTVDPSKWSSRRGACEFDWYWSANPPSRRRRTDQPASSGLRAFHIHVTVAFQTTRRNSRAQRKGGGVIVAILLAHPGGVFTTSNLSWERRPAEVAQGVMLAPTHQRIDAQLLADGGASRPE